MSLRSFNAAYSYIEVQDPAIINDFANNKRHDEIYRVFQMISQHLLDPHRTVYANTANWHRVRTTKSDGKGHRLCLYSVLSPEAFVGFASVTIMGAMFKQSLLYLLWSENPRIKFRVHRMITKRLRYSLHTRGDLITVEYLMDHSWSKNFRDHELPDGQTVLDHVVAEAQHSMVGKEFIYVVNKDVESPLAEAFASGQRVSSFCHGLNAYQGIDNIVFLSALNPAPSQFTFLESMGVNGDELRRANYLLSLYQAVMRISIRDPANSRPKTIVVTDKDAADHLAGIFPGCAVVKNANMPILPGKSAGRQKIWKDDAARHRARREKTRHLRELATLQTKPLAYGISIVPSIYSKDVLHQEVPANELLISELRDALETEVAIKEQNILISPARFNTSKSNDTRRGLANIESIFGV